MSFTRHHWRVAMVSLTLGALSTASLPVPNELIGVNVQLLVNPVSPGASYTSEYLLIPPGGNVSLRLADELGMSRISVQ